MSEMQFYLCVALLAQAFFAGGQLLLKAAMTTPPTRTRVWRVQVALYFAGAIALMTIWYFAWLRCKVYVDMSRLIAMEGVQPVLFTLAGLVLLKHQIHWRTWLAVGLISAGIVLVGLSH